MKVYLSSTYADLLEHRRKVAEVLAIAGYDVESMERYGASEERPLDRCLEDVRACDFYIGIFAWRYGYIPPGYDRSITTLEYEEAGKVGHPRLIFLTGPVAPWPEDLKETGDGAQKLLELRNRLMTDHLVKCFDNPDELAALVVASLGQETQRVLGEQVQEVRERVAAAGPVGAEQARVVNARPLDAAHFTDRAPERESLKGLLFDNDVRMVRIVGRPGIGKTALACHVIAEYEPNGSQDERLDAVLYLRAGSTALGLERIYADVRRMIDEAGRTALAAAWTRPEATITDKVEVLVEHMPEGRFVILVDGAENLLGDERQFVDDGLREVIAACLHHREAARLVLTSRVEPAVPADALAGARTLQLDEGLATDDAVALLQALDPERRLGLADAAREDLERAAELTYGIPRALEVLAGILDSDPAASLEQLLADEGAFAGQTVESVVAEGYKRLGPDAQRVLQAMAVFGTPTDLVAVSFLLHPWFHGIDVPAVARRLVSSNFATADRATGTYALQRLDRDHAYRQIPEEAEADPLLPGAPPYTRREVEGRAADFFASIRKSAAEWRSLQDVRPQVAEYRHRLRAGQVDQALELLSTIDEEHLFLWGNYTLLIELRRAALDLPARPELKAANLASLATNHQVLGQFDQAIGYYEAAVATAHDIGDLTAEKRFVGNLGRLYRNVGRMQEAVDAFQGALTSSIEAGDREDQSFWLDRLSLAYRAMGRLDEAVTAHTRALDLARAIGYRRGEGTALSNIALVHLARGDWALAGASLDGAIEAAREIDDRRGIVICLGRLGMVAEGEGESALARDRFTEALGLARQLGDRREESYQLLGLGRLAVAAGDLQVARDQLVAARALDVPDTNCLAPAALGLRLAHQHDDGAVGVLADAVERCREMLRRCAELYEVRYVFAAALVGTAVVDARWADEAPRSTLLAPALAEYDRALETCRAAAVVAAARRDVERLATGVAGLEPVVSRLSEA